MNSNVIMDYSDLITRFEYIQQKHSTFKLILLQQKSLLYESVPMTDNNNSNNGNNKQNNINITKINSK